MDRSGQYHYPIHFTAGEAGTYVTGVSTKPRSIELTAVKFNNYLEHDGVKHFYTFTELSASEHNMVINNTGISITKKHATHN